MRMATTYMQIERKAKKQKRIKKAITMATHSLITVGVIFMISVLIGGII